MISSKFLNALNIYTRKQETLARSNNASRETSALAAILTHVAPEDLDAKRAEIRTVENLRNALDVMKYANELDHFRIRCLNTGRVIGTLSLEDVSTIFAMHPVERAKRHIAIAQRRVSPTWLSTDGASLDILQFHDPKGYLAYLLGMWFRRCDPRLLPGTINYVAKEAAAEWDYEQRFIYDRVEEWFATSEDTTLSLTECIRRLMVVSSPANSRAFHLYNKEDTTRDILAWDVFKSHTVFDALRIVKANLRKFVNFARAQNAIVRGRISWDKVLVIQNLLGHFPNVASQSNARDTFNAALIAKAKEERETTSASGGTGRFLIKPKSAAKSTTDSIQRTIDLIFKDVSAEDIEASAIAARINEMDFAVTKTEVKEKPKGKTLKELIEAKRNANPAPMQTVAVKPPVPAKPLSLKDLIAKAKAAKE